MQKSEKTVKEIFEKRGYDVLLGDYSKEPGIPDFKCINFETGEKFYLEVKLSSQQFTLAQFKKIKELLSKKQLVYIATVYENKVELSRMKPDFSLEKIETIKYEPRRTKKYYSQTCRLCEYRWESKVSDPKACPKCKRYDWKEAIKISVIILFSLFTIPTLARAATWTTLSQSDFNQGTYSWTYYNTTTGAVILNHTGALVYNTSGSHTSKVYDAGANATWYNTSWIEGVPYGDNLPDNQADRFATVLGEANMTGNVLLIHFNDGSGNTAVDSSGHGNNGTLYNATTQIICSDSSGCPTWTNGRFGSALQFDGNSSYVKITDPTSTDNMENFTLSAWVYPLAGYGSGSSPRIVDKGPSHARIYLSSSNGEVQCDAANSTTDYVFATTGHTVPINAWSYITCVFNVTTVSVYVNGIFSASTTTSGQGTITSRTGNFYIGDWGDGVRVFNGTMDEVAVWNRTLSDTEILNHYKRGMLRLNITTRSCDDSTCSGESWNETHTNSTLSSLHEKNNRYFQYKAQFETDNTSYTPELYNVTINHVFLGVNPNATAAKRGDFLNITINSSSTPTANITKPNGAVTWLAAPASKGNSIYETNYTFLSSDPSGSYRIGANTSELSDTTNVTMNSIILISIESDKMGSDRAIKTRSSKSILAYGMAKYAIDSSALNGKTVTVDYSSTTLGTNTTNSAGSYNLTFSIPYDGDYYLNVNISDSYNNTGTNSTNMTIKSRPTYVKYRFSYHLGNYSNTTYRIATPTPINASLGTSSVSNRQYSTNLSHAYVCTYNDLDFSGGMVLALTHSYKMTDLDYVNFSTSFTEQASNYTLELRSSVDNSKLILVYTKSSCQLVDDKMYLIEKQTVPTKPMASIGLETPDRLPVSIIAQYDKIQLYGTERFGKGSYRICVEKPGVSEGNKPLVNVSRC